MTLPTCWYCPECGHFRHRALPADYLHVGNDGYECSGEMIRGSFVADGTPLPVILDALGIEYRTGGMRDFGDGTFEVDEIESNGLPLDLDRNRVPVLVVDNSATDEVNNG